LSITLNPELAGFSSRAMKGNDSEERTITLQLQETVARFRGCEEEVIFKEIFPN
jgi:hypothetical protein